MMSFEEADILSRIIKAMAHPVRLMIIDALRTVDPSACSSIRRRPTYVRLGVTRANDGL